MLSHIARKADQPHMEIAFRPRDPFAGKHQPPVEVIREVNAEEKASAEKAKAAEAAEAAAEAKRASGIGKMEARIDTLAADQRQLHDEVREIKELLKESLAAKRPRPERAAPRLPPRAAQPLSEEPAALMAARLAAEAWQAVQPGPPTVADFAAEASRAVQSPAHRQPPSHD